MKARVLRVLPILMLVVGVVSFLFLLVSGLSRSLTLAQLDVAYVIAFGMFLPLGILLALRRPSNPIGWIMAAIGFFTLTEAAATEYATRALIAEPGSLPVGDEMAFAATVLGIPGISLLPFLVLLFPTGKPPSPRWKWVARIATANFIFITITQLSLWPLRGRELLVEEVPEGTAFPVWFFDVAWMVVLATAVSGLVSLVFRFRRSSGVERQQLKWMSYVATVVGSLVVLLFFILEPLGAPPTVLATSEQVLNVAVVGIPVATAIAISRYRLYEIDVLINRTLVYGTLTAILVATYIGLVFALQGLLAPVTAESDLAVAASTLAVAALFRPLRTRIQGFIDRRFYRKKFDAQKTVEDFGVHLRDEVELESLTHRFVSAVQDTMQPAHVSLWLRKEVGS